MTRQTITLLATIAGGALTANAAEPMMPQLAPRGTMPSKHVAHIYYNIATGERIATLLDGADRWARSDSSAVWVAENALPCADFGQTSSTAGVMDDPDCTTCFSEPPSIFLDWADIPSDTVVDCVGISWASQIPDVDLDGDGLGDGVEGFGAVWSWYDADNGFDSSDTRLPILSIMLSDLPGQIAPFDPNELATFEATIDLAPGGGPSLAFEIGDTDAVNGAGTPFFNPGGGLDLDFDGLADFAYSLRYIQPGTFDFDGDGSMDGDILDADLTAWTLVVGSGEVSADGSTYIPETEAPGAMGIEDVFDIYIDFNGDGILKPIGTFFYGGFACDLDGNGDFEHDNSRPFSQFYMRLYGEICGTCTPLCAADIFPDGDPDGVLNFFDVSMFIDLFVSGDRRANLVASDINGSTINFFDLNAYIGLFNAGCP